MYYWFQGTSGYLRVGRSSEYEPPSFFYIFLARGTWLHPSYNCKFFFEVGPIMKLDTLGGGSLDTTLQGTCESTFKI